MPTIRLKRALAARLAAQERLIRRKNARVGDGRWVLDRYRHPVVTAEHVPLAWRVDFDPRTNPFGVERLGVNAAFNPGAIELGGRLHLVVRVEGYDRKSFFAVASEPDRDRRLPVPRSARRLRRGGAPRRQRVRHAPHRARGRVDLWPVLRGAEGPGGAPGRHVERGGPVRHRADAGPRALGTLAGSRLRVATAAERGAASPLRERPVRVVHAPAGRVHRGGHGGRHRLGARPVDGARRDRRRDASSSRRSTTPSRK